MLTVGLHTLEFFALCFHQRCIHSMVLRSILKKKKTMCCTLNVGVGWSKNICKLSCESFLTITCILCHKIWSVDTNRVGLLAAAPATSKLDGTPPPKKKRKDILSSIISRLCGKCTELNGRKWICNPLFPFFFLSGFYFLINSEVAPKMTSDHLRYI